MKFKVQTKCSSSSAIDDKYNNKWHDVKGDSQFGAIGNLLCQIADEILVMPKHPKICLIETYFYDDIENRKESECIIAWNIILKNHVIAISPAGRPELDEATEFRYKIQSKWIKPNPEHKLYVAFLERVYPGRRFKIVNGMLFTEINNSWDNIYEFIQINKPSGDKGIVLHSLGIDNKEHRTYSTVREFIEYLQKEYFDKKGILPCELNIPCFEEMKNEYPGLFIKNDDWNDVYPYIFSVASGK